MTDFKFEDDRLLSSTDKQADERPSRWAEPMWKLTGDEEPLELAGDASARQASGRPWALLLDGGDLRDVHRILSTAETPLVRLTDTVPTKECWPQRLLVASGNRAVQLERHPIDPDDEVVTIAVLSKPSRTLARRVTSLGFDYVIERPVHPEAMRRLLMAALYRERERRAERRFPVGWNVRFKAGWRRREAVLAELSRWGCSLRIENAPDLGARIKVCLPAELTESAPLVLAADVVRSERCSRQDVASHVSLVFDRDPRTRAQLGSLLSKLRHGPLAQKAKAS